MLSADEGKRSEPATTRPVGGTKAPTDDAGFPPASLTLDIDGAVRFTGAARSILNELMRISDSHPADRAGIRLHCVEALRPHLSNDGVLGMLAAVTLGANSQPVRAILFDKTATTNWALGWHQDRIIVVRERIDIPGFGPWTVKSGLVHVEPPAALLAGMLTMRVHLDAVPETNAPLLIARGSHKHGRIPEGEIEAVVERHGIATCMAEAGDVWLYATPILHASAASAVPAHRRVVQIDFAATDLPGGLTWLGV